MSHDVTRYYRTGTMSETLMRMLRSAAAGELHSCEQEGPRIR